MFYMKHLFQPTIGIMAPKFSEKRQFGNLGEDLACRFLMKHGFLIKDQNYLKPWGEIDIVAEKAGKLHFIEVKAATFTSDVTHETASIRPEENMHPQKLARLERTILTYLSEKHVSHETDWQLDLLVVFIDEVTKRAKIDRIEYIA
jgi:putative endonuclease